MITLIYGDCNKFLATCNDKQYSLGVVDPPYGIGMDGGNVGYKGDNNFVKKEWDNAIPHKEYFDELRRVSVNQIIWGGNYFPLPLSRGFIIWDKGEGFYNRTYAECEFAWISFDRNAKIFKWDPLARGDYHGKINPCQKPIQLYKWLLKNYTKEGDTILDTHGGSMSSVIACIDGGFDMTCIELDPDYFEAGVKRVKNYMSQLDVFIERPELKIIEL